MIAAILFYSLILGLLVAGLNAFVHYDVPELLAAAGKRRADRKLKPADRVQELEAELRADGVDLSAADTIARIDRELAAEERKRNPIAAPFRILDHVGERIVIKPKGAVLIATRYGVRRAIEADVLVGGAWHSTTLFPSAIVDLLWDATPGPMVEGVLAEEVSPHLGRHLSLCTDCQTESIWTLGSPNPLKEYVTPCPKHTSRTTPTGSPRALPATAGRGSSLPARLEPSRLATARPLQFTARP